MLPAVGAVLMLLGEGLMSRGRAGTSLVAVLVYLGLMLVYAVIGWRWHVRHLLPGALRPSAWYQFTHLGVPPRLRLLAPPGVVLFGIYTVLLAMRAVESAISEDWSGLISELLFMFLWLALLFRCALATWRLFVARSRSDS